MGVVVGYKGWVLLLSVIISNVNFSSRNFFPLFLKVKILGTVALVLKLV